MIFSHLVVLYYNTNHNLHKLRKNTIAHLLIPIASQYHLYELYTSLAHKLACLSIYLISRKQSIGCMHHFEKDPCILNPPHLAQDQARNWAITNTSSSSTCPSSKTILFLKVQISFTTANHIPLHT